MRLLRGLISAVLEKLARATVTERYCSAAAAVSAERGGVARDSPEFRYGAPFLAVLVAFELPLAAASNYAVAGARGGRSRRPRRPERTAATVPDVV